MDIRLIYCFVSMCGGNGRILCNKIIDKMENANGDSVLFDVHIS